MASRSRTKAPTSGGTQPSPRPSFDAVATRAYEIWRESGGVHGNDQAHWFQAEHELEARTRLR